jgi:3-(3-hydroxy-phenyl)propionate hydroxylase
MPLLAYVPETADVPRGADLPRTADVIVVGLGPTGAVLSHLLARAGLRVTVFERDPEVHPKPRAVFFDDEIMRLLAALGLAHEAGAFTRPVQGMDLVNRAGDLLYQYRPAAPRSELGFAEGYMFSQPDLETLLRRSLADLATVELVLGAEVESVERLGLRQPESELPADAPHALVRGDLPRPWYLVTAATLDGAQVTAQAPFVVGCDGARSTVRVAVGSDLEQLGPDADWLVVDLQLDPGVQAWLDLPDVTVQYCDPGRPATFVPLPGDRVRFEIRLLPGDDREALVTPDALRELLRTWMPADDYTVERAVIYTFHALLAERWRHEGLFLAGDAAHQMPPFLGQGMCSGIRDAANLAWKLAWVAQGWGSDALLDTYASERSAQTRAVIEVDLELGDLIQTTDPERAEMRDEQARRAGGAVPISPPRIPIGPGMRSEDPPAGLPAPHLGEAFTTVAGPGGLLLIGSMTPSPSASKLLDALGARRDLTPSGPLAEWLADLDAEAILVRPDGLVGAVLRSADELDAWFAAHWGALAPSVQIAGGVA